MWKEYVGPFSKILHFSHVWSVDKTSSSNVLLFVTNKYLSVQPIANQALKGAGALRSHKNVTVSWAHFLWCMYGQTFFVPLAPFPAPPHYVYVTNMMLHENICSLAEA